MLYRGEVLVLRFVLCCVVFELPCDPMCFGATGLGPAVWETKAGRGGAPVKLAAVVTVIIPTSRRSAG